MLCLGPVSCENKSQATNIKLFDGAPFIISTEQNFYLDYTKHSIQRQICGGPELKRLCNISLKHDLFGCEWRKWLQEKKKSLGLPQ